MKLAQLAGLVAAASLAACSVAVTAPAGPPSEVPARRAEPGAPVPGASGGPALARARRVAVLEQSLTRDWETLAAAAATPGPLACRDTCRITERICEASTKICLIADESPGELDLPGRCQRARGHCQRASRLCAGCRSSTPGGQRSIPAGSGRAVADAGGVGGGAGGEPRRGGSGALAFPMLVDQLGAALCLPGLWSGLGLDGQSLDGWGRRWTGPGPGLWTVPVKAGGPQVGISVEATHPQRGSGPTGAASHPDPRRRR
jgi:hypothetical protein